MKAAADTSGSVNRYYPPPFIAYAKIVFYSLDCSFPFLQTSLFDKERQTQPGWNGWVRDNR